MLSECSRVSAQSHKVAPERESEAAVKSNKERIRRCKESEEQVIESSYKEHREHPKGRSARSVHILRRRVSRGECAFQVVDDLLLELLCVL